MAARTTKVFIHTSVLMELLLDRPRRAEAVRAIEALHGLTPRIRLRASILAVNTVFYYIEKYGLDKRAAYEFFASYDILDAGPADFDWARRHDEWELEDALQISSALRSNCDLLLTFDPALAAKYGKHIAMKLIA